MPLRYKPKEGVKKRTPLDPEKVRQAVRAVQDGGSYKGTAKRFHINVMTLKRLVRKGVEEVPGYQKAQVFNETEEKELGVFLQNMTNMYYGLTVTQLRKLAYQYAVSNNKTFPTSWEKNKQAGRDWFRGFFRRNSWLSLRTPEPTSLARSTAFNKHTVAEFFGKLTDVYKRFSFLPERIWNVDETGVTTVHKPSKIIAVKGVKQVGKMTSAERGELVTVCAAVNASGNHTPPFTIFPRVNWQARMLNGAPPGSDGVAHPSGWMTGPTFLKFLHHFTRFAQPSTDRKHLIILDNHDSHIQIESLNYAKENGIVLLTIPPHTSHKLQPLDRTVFGPLKTYYFQAAANWMLEHPGRVLTIYEISELLGKAYPRAMSPLNIMNGFRVSGIWPLNQSIFSEDEFLSSAVTDRPMPTEELKVINDQSTYASETKEEGSSISISIVPTTPTSNQKDGDHCSPQDILPYPKAAPRKPNNKGRKRGRCRVLTDTPEKKEIEELSLKKEWESRRKKQKITKATVDSSDEEEEDDLLSLPESSGGSNFASEEDNWDDSDIEDEAGPGDYVLVKFVTHKSQTYYVGKVISVDEAEATLKINFLRRKGLQGNFIFPEIPDIYVVPKSDAKKLPPPKTKGTTRTAGIFHFNYQFENCVC